MSDHVILVDPSDRELGTAEKGEAHRAGALHRAFSIFVFNSAGALMLQRRARTKYHSGGLWTNTCCGHPRPFEPIQEAVHRRLREEMGFDCDLKEIFSFTYKVQFDNSLLEHEYDHVFVGTYEGDVAPNPEEVDGWRWMDLGSLRKDIQENSDCYTYWFRTCIEGVVSYLNGERHMLGNGGGLGTVDSQ
jgi:isopentenyl-diphosphate delta-isomerase